MVRDGRLGEPVRGTSSHLACPGTRIQRMQPAPTYRFGPFSFDPGRGILRRGKATVPLAAQPARALGVLLARAGQVVTREELRHALWGERAVEAETGLNFCLHQVRTALGDEARQPTYIATEPGAGYRFIAPVRTGSWRVLARRIAVAAAAVVVIAFIAGPRTGGNAIRGLAAETNADPAIPVSARNAVASRVDSIASLWRPAGAPVSHRVLVHGAPTDTGAAVRWEIQLVNASSRVLAAGAVTTEGLDPGAEAPWVAEAVEGLVEAWLDRSSPPLQRFTRVSSPDSTH